MFLIDFRMKELEILLFNKDSSQKELQKENDFLMTELAYQKKAYVKLKFKSITYIFFNR